MHAWVMKCGFRDGFFLNVPPRHWTASRRARNSGAVYSIKNGYGPRKTLMLPRVLPSEPASGLVRWS